jgi:hypothetical protein
LAAIHKVSADVTLFAMNDDTFNEKDKMPDSKTTCRAGPAANSSQRLIISETSPVTILRAYDNDNDNNNIMMIMLMTIPNETYLK